MNIKTFSELVGVSAYTLRFYEKIGLLKVVKRNASGHRYYTASDTEWIKFVVRLKETGMPLEQIKQYSDYREIGDTTLQQRKAMLDLHRDKIRAEIELQQNHLSALESKIAFYQDRISS